MLPGGQSTLARLVVVDVPAGWTDAARLSAAQAEVDHYALAGAAWIEHLAANFDALSDQLAAARDALRDALLPRVHHPQHALAAATLLLALSTWLEYAIDLGALSRGEAAERLVIADEAIRAAARRSGEVAGDERPTHCQCSWFFCQRVVQRKFVTPCPHGSVIARCAPGRCRGR